MGVFVGIGVGAVCFTAMAVGFAVGAFVGSIVGVGVGGCVGTAVGCASATGAAVRDPVLAATELHTHIAKMRRSVPHPRPNFVFFGS